jgi:hypothetical protein
VVGKNVVKNRQVIQKEIAKQGKGVEKELAKKGGIYTDKEFSSKWNKLKGEDRSFLFQGQAKLKNAYNSALNEFERIRAEFPNTLNGLYKARKKFDKYVRIQTKKATGKTIFDLDPSTNVQAASVKDVRNFVNDFIEATAKDVAFKNKMHSMSNLIKAQDAIAEIHGGDPLSLIEAGIKGLKSLGTAPTVAAGLGIGAAATQAPILLGAGGALYTTAKVGSAAYRKLIEALATTKVPQFEVGGKIYETSKILRDLSAMKEGAENVDLKGA